MAAVLSVLLSATLGCGKESQRGFETQGADEIAFICDSRYSLCLVGADGRGERLITSEIQVNSFAWSPAGDRIVFATVGWWRFKDAQYIGGDDLYVMNVDGSREPLTSGASHDRDPAWSPHGTLIAFTSDRDLERTSETAGASGSIYVLNLEDRTLRRLTHGRHDRESAWSPDGTEIAFIRDTDVWIASADATNSRRLPISRPQFPTSLAWSPDGRQIAVGDFEGGIHVVNADGSENTRIEFDPPIVYDADEPTWSPDGRHIAFAGASDCPAIFVAEVDGGSTRRVSACEPEYDVADAPAWRPDGK